MAQGFVKGLIMRVIVLRSLTLAALVAAFVAPSPAQAWYRHGWGWGWGPPIVVVPYAPPPVYYGAPPVAYYSRPAGQACYAGPYVCPLDQAGPVGAQCSCPTNGKTRSWGQIR